MTWDTMMLMLRPKNWLHAVLYWLCWYNIDLFSCEQTKIAKIASIMSNVQTSPWIRYSAKTIVMSRFSHTEGINISKYEVNMWNVNCARATPFIFGSRTDVLVEVSIFLRQRMSPTYIYILYTYISIFSSPNYIPSLLGLCDKIGRIYHE